MQEEYKDISNTKQEILQSFFKREPNRMEFYKPDLDIVRQALSNAIMAVKLDNIDNSLRALEKFTQNIFPTSEKEISATLGRKHYRWLIGNDSAEIKLKKESPLEITFEKGEELITAYNDTFNLSGIGSTREEALKDLIEFFIHDYLSYRNTPHEKLSKEAKSLLQQYEDVIDTCNEL